MVISVLYFFYTFTEITKTTVFALSLWGIGCRLMRTDIFREQNVEKVKGNEYFLKALYLVANIRVTVTVSTHIQSMNNSAPIVNTFN